MDNLFADLAPPLEGERFDVLLRHKGLTIERIVSSPRIAHERYVQAQDEWVVLLQGQAVMDVDGRTVPFTSGDHLFLPAQTPHTVLQVSDGALWLAVQSFRRLSSAARQIRRSQSSRSCASSIFPGARRSESALNNGFSTSLQQYSAPTTRIPESR